ncbi:hypothetical protein [Streptomyces sp. or20]|uniref:hypothetical protein n=1 Tax=Streptomyces sp. or20 TaxID=1828016 RepID=UPI000BF0DB8D|nr:hypothetical protein [Streptomyces sp. or20]
MTHHAAQCAHATGDEIRAHTVGAHVFLTSVVDRELGTVALESDDARTFARGILALADEVDGGKTKPEPVVRIGDTVTIVRPEGCCDPEYRGRVGVLTDVDNTDCKYRVRVEGAERDIVWSYEVRPLEPTPARADRESLVTRAKELLTGTPHTVTDIIAMANFLAGE